MPIKILFEREDSDENLCGVLAELGLHTGAIAGQLGLKPSEVMYRIAASGNIGVRRSYRNGGHPLFKEFLRIARRRRAKLLLLRAQLAVQAFRKANREKARQRKSRQHRTG